MVHDQSGQNTSINFVNSGAVPVHIYRADSKGKHQKYFSLTPGKSQIQASYTHHYWVAKTTDGNCIGIYQNPSDTQLTIEIKAGTEQKATPYQRYAEPPFHGTIFLDQDIIVDSDPHTFVSIAPTGKEMRTMYDRRVEKFIRTEAFLFKATYSDNLTIEVQVNQEFGSVTHFKP